VKATELDKIFDAGGDSGDIEIDIEIIDIKVHDSWRNLPRIRAWK